jgi:hypothetical protein
MTAILFADLFTTDPAVARSCIPHASLAYLPNRGLTTLLKMDPKEYVRPKETP